MICLTWLFRSKDSLVKVTGVSLGLGISLHPLSGSSFPSIAVALPLLSDAHFLGVLGIRGLHDSQDGLDHKLSVQGGHPIGVDSLGADLTGVCLYARVVNLGDELDLRGLEGIVVCEVEVDCEFAADERCAFGSIDVDVPNHDVVLSGLDRHTWDRLSRQVTEFLHNKSQG